MGGSAVKPDIHWVSQRDHFLVLVHEVTPNVETTKHCFIWYPSAINVLSRFNTM